MRQQMNGGAFPVPMRPRTAGAHRLAGRHRAVAAMVALLAILSALLLGGCAGLLGPREVSLPLAKMEEKLENRFPINKRYLEIFEISLHHPRLTLLPDANRVMISANASLSSVLSSKAWQGKLAVSGTIKLDSAKNAITFSGARLDALDFDGINPSQQRQIGIIGNLVADQLLKDVTIYSFNSDELRRAGTTFVPTRIAMTSTAIMVTFEPVK